MDFPIWMCACVHACMCMCACAHVHVCVCACACAVEGVRRCRCMHERTDDVCHHWVLWLCPCCLCWVVLVLRRSRTGPDALSSIEARLAASDRLGIDSATRVKVRYPGVGGQVGVGLLMVCFWQNAIMACVVDWGITVHHIPPCPTSIVCESRT